MMGAAVSTTFLLLVLLLGGGVWVGLALFATGALTLSMFAEVPVAKLLALDLWQNMNAPELAALPLFVMMGEILFHTRLSRDLFDGLTPWIARIPGGLLHTNILGCTLFAAVSGSSAATTATIGRLTLAELEKRGYNADLAMGSLCGAGTLGFLIPPSIILILYGVLAEASILDLFVAGIIPGAILAASYMGYVALRAWLQPGLTPGSGHSYGWGARFRGLAKLAPVALLLALVLGSMYAGLASPSEAAVIGVFGAFVVAALHGSLGRETLAAALMGSVKTVSMIGLIVAGALFLSRSMAFLGIPAGIAEWVAALGLAPLALVLLLLAFYVALGTILDGLSVIIMTLPIVLPLVTGAGFDLIWFGIFLVVAVEMAQITPPVGFNLFVVQSLTGRPIARIARASFPFFLIMAGFVLLIALFPAIVTFLPALL